MRLTTSQGLMLLLLGACCSASLWIASASATQENWETYINRGEEAQKVGQYNEARRWFMKAQREAQMPEGNSYQLNEANVRVRQLYLAQRQAKNPEKYPVKDSLSEKPSWLNLNKKTAVMSLPSEEELISVPQEPASSSVSVTNEAMATLAMPMDVQQSVEAEKIILDALQVIEVNLGQNHPQFAPLVFALGQYYQGQQRWAEAEATLKTSLALDEKNLGPTHDSTKAVRFQLEKLYRDTGREEEADKLSALSQWTLQSGKQSDDRSTRPSLTP